MVSHFDLFERPIFVFFALDLNLCRMSIDFSTLYLGSERTAQGADVLNGISVAEDPDLLYITGKNWDRMFLVR